MRIFVKSVTDQRGSRCIPHLDRGEKKWWRESSWREEWKYESYRTYSHMHMYAHMHPQSTCTHLQWEHMGWEQCNMNLKGKINNMTYFTDIHIIKLHWGHAGSWKEQWMWRGCVANGDHLQCELTTRAYTEHNRWTYREDMLTHSPYMEAQISEK